jgi:hypothetical protein
MSQLSRKHWILAAMCLAAIPLAAAATAFACGNLAYLKLNRSTARPGDQVTARGGNYNTSPRASAIQLRFNSRNGRVLWEGRPNANGKFASAFTVPNARPGYYVLVTTQVGPDGRPAAGTPGRTPLRVKGASSSRSSAAPLTPFGSAPPDDGGPPQAAPVGLLAGIGIGVLAFGLLGGALAVVRLGRRRRVDVARSVS